MKNSRRLERMKRASKRYSPGLNLVALMDVFTILVFFLLINSASNDVATPPKSIDLPASVAENRPRETVSILVTENNVLVQGRNIIDTQSVASSADSEIEEIIQSLAILRGQILGTSEQALSDSDEVTILAHKTLPFDILKKIMSSCTYAGYEKISLAVIQKSNKK